jgi:hypothetical protein
MTGKSRFSEAVLGLFTNLSILVILLIILPLHPFIVQAADTIIEKDLRRSFEDSRSILDAARDKMITALSLDDQIVALKNKAEEIRASHLLLLERFRLQGEATKALGTTARDRHSAMLNQYREVVEEYLTLVGGLSGGETIPESSLSALQSLAAKVVSKRKLPIFGALPYRHVSYASKDPVRTPVVKPAYKGGNTAVTPDDLKATAEAPLSTEIAVLAQSLNWNPVSIYEWVKNGVETEWYWGCMKGAEETLNQASGNDCDQAALLLALLRASGFPSRYVRGVIELDAERLKNLTGIEDEGLMAQFFQKSGIPFTPVIKGGKISAFEVDHIWVESQVPFANFHGAVVDEHGKTWLGLDTSIKVSGYLYSSPIDGLQGLSVSDLRDQYLSAVQTETPLEYLKKAVTAYLDSAYPGKSYDDALRTKTPLPEILNILPASLQYREAAVTREYSAIPDDLIHKVRVSATDTANKELFDITLETSKLSNRQVVIAYEPETVEDHEITNSFGGLENTPPFLVRLRPGIKVNGEWIAVGKDGLAMGSDYRLALEFISPQGAEKVTSTHIAGNVSAIGIVAQRATQGGIQGIPLSEAEDGEQLLYWEAVRYIERWNEAEEELAALMNLAVSRPTPSVATVGGIIDVTYLLGSPQGFEWKGVFVDAGLRTIEAVGSRAEPTGTEIDFMKLSSLQGSVLENRIFEDDFQMVSISAAKVFSLASAAAPPIEILTVDQSNIGTVLPLLPFDEDIKQDIENAVHQGLAVRIPRSEIAYEDWTGVGYVKEDPATGESGYMLSGMVAGGMTAGGKDKWEKYADWVLVLLDKKKPTNEDPQAAVYIYKMAGSDRESFTVGTESLLAVQALDKDLRPVKGAEILFAVKAGGGFFINVLGKETDSIAKYTNAKGIASASFTVGKKTASNPTYVQVVGQAYAQQVGENIITAELTNTGRYTSRPFVVYGMPGNPKTMKKTFGDKATTFPLSFAGFVSVAIEDEFGNPIANLPIAFGSDTATERNSCALTYSWSHPKALLIDGNDPCLAKYPTSDNCQGKSSVVQKTDSLGTASVHVILGDVPGADYPVETVYGPSLNPASLRQTFTLSTLSIGNCAGTNPPQSFLWIQTIYPTDAYGRAIDAAASGATIPVRARLTSVKEGDRPLHCGGANIPSCIVGSRAIVVGKDYKNPVVTFGGNPGAPQGDGVFKGDVTVSAGKNDIKIEAGGDLSVRHSDNDCTKTPPCAGIVIDDETLNVFDTITVYGIDVSNVQLLKVNEDGSEVPAPSVKVDYNGLTLTDFAITYEIVPSDYKAETAFVVILKEDGGNYTPIYYIPTETQDKGRGILAKGYKFELGSSYYARVVLNPGRTFENRSLEIRSPLILLLKRPESGELVVSPDSGFNSSGPDPDCKFNPSSKTYTLKNTGKASLDFQTPWNEKWLTVSPINGTIKPGESATVTASIVPEEAKKLAEDKYTDQVQFQNTSNGVGNTSRAVTLEVGEEQLWRVILKGYQEDVMDPYWQITTGATGAIRFDYTLWAEFVIKKKNGQWTYNKGKITKSVVTVSNDYMPAGYWVIKLPLKCSGCTTINSLAGRSLSGLVTGNAVTINWALPTPKVNVDAKLSASCTPMPECSRWGDRLFMAEDFSSRTSDVWLPLQDGYETPAPQASSKSNTRVMTWKSLPYQATNSQGTTWIYFQYRLDRLKPKEKCE